MAAMTLSEMIVKVGELIKDPEHEEYSENFLRDTIDAVLQLHCYNLGMLKQRRFIPFMEGIDIYPFHYDMLNLMSMKLVNYRGKLLTHTGMDTEAYLDNGNLGSSTQPKQGTPVVFFTDEVPFGMFRVAPCPTELDIASDTALNSGGAIPTQLTNGGVPVPVSGQGPISHTTYDTVVMPTQGAGVGTAIFIGESGVEYWYNRKANTPTVANKTEPLDAELINDFWLARLEYWAASEILSTSSDGIDLQKAQRYKVIYEEHKGKKKSIKNTSPMITRARAI